MAAGSHLRRKPYIRDGRRLGRIYEGTEHDDEEARNASDHMELDSFRIRGLTDHTSAR